MAPFRRRKKQKRGNYAFIDSQNLNLGTQKMGWKMDWRKFRQFLKDQHQVDKAFMFIGYMPDNEKLYDQMHDAGYLVVLKPTLEMLQKKELPTDQLEAKEKPATKGNVDAELVLYAVKEMPNYHKALIVSGDGDFYGLIEYLVQNNKLQKVLAPNWQYSSLLKPFENHIIRLDQKRHELAYRDFKRKR